MTVRVPPHKPDATPAEREARIKALHERRQERRRERALRAVFIGTGLVLLLVVAAWWLLGTIGGRDVLLAQIVARLPADSTLTWERAEGPASGSATRIANRRRTRAARWARSCSPRAG